MQKPPLGRFGGAISNRDGKILLRDFNRLTASAPHLARWRITILSGVKHYLSLERLEPLSKNPRVVAHRHQLLHHQRALIAIHVCVLLALHEQEQPFNVRIEFVLLFSHAELVR